MTRIYEPAFDGLRGIAIVLVVLFHLGLASGGFLGVDVFFVLSGFLITRRLVDEAETTGAIRFSLFYVRRALRLFPALFVVLVIGTLWAAAFFPPDLRQSTTRGAVAAALYASNWVSIAGGDQALGAFGHMWSVSIEEQFYAIWPLLLLLTMRWTSRPIVAIASIAVVLALYRAGLAIAGVDVWRLYNGFDTRADGLMLGAAAAFLLRRPLSDQWTTIASRVSFGGLFVMALLIFEASYLQLRTYVAVIPITNVLAATAIIVSAGPAASVTRRLLRARPLSWLGRISYSLYLWHLPVLVAIRYWPLGHANAFVGVAVSVGLACASYYGVERPALRLKSYFEPTLDSAAVASRT